MLGSSSVDGVNSSWTGNHISSSSTKRGTHQ